MSCGLTLLYLVTQAEDRAKITIRVTINASRLYDLLWVVLTTRPWAVRSTLAKNAFPWHPSREHSVCGSFERHIGTLPPKKVPMKQKTCQILRKLVICDSLLLNCITAKRFEILNSTITETTCIKFFAWELFWWQYTYMSFK